MELDDAGIDRILNTVGDVPGTLDKSEFRKDILAAWDFYQGYKREGSKGARTERRKHATKIAHKTAELIRLLNAPAGPGALAFAGGTTEGGLAVTPADLERTALENTAGTGEPATTLAPGATTGDTVALPEVTVSSGGDQKGGPSILDSDIIEQSAPGEAAATDEQKTGGETEGPELSASEQAKADEESARADEQGRTGLGIISEAEARRGGASNPDAQARSDRDYTIPAAQDWVRSHIGRLLSLRERHEDLLRERNEDEKIVSLASLTRNLGELLSVVETIKRQCTGTASFREVLNVRPSFWLIGNDLVKVFEKRFAKQADRTRDLDGQPDSPFVRFVTAVTAELGEPVLAETVSTAMSAVAKVMKTDD